MELRILGDNSQLWQWDTGQKLIVEDDGTCNEVHFCNRSSETALVVPIREQNGIRLVDVPNILLQESSALTAYLYRYDADGSETRFSYHFPLRPRPKPEGYVYTETEVLNYASLDKRLNALEGEGLAQAVADYLKENPVQAGATAEEATQIQQNKLDIEQLAQGKLDATKLPEAVNDALTQAKASGEFKGEPGNDGKTPVKGVDYFTEADKKEIAEQAAELVEVPEGGTVTDEQIASAVEDYMAENPVEAGEENLYEFSEINTDIIGAMGNSALCGKRTIDVVPSGNANVMNCGVMALHNSYNNILAYTKFDSGDVITNGSNTGTIYAVVQKTNDGSFELSVSEPIAIVKYGDKVLGIDGVTEYELNSGAVADTMFTVNGNTVLIFEAYARPAGSTAVAKRMVFATTFPKPASTFAAVDVSAYSQPKALSLVVDSENVDFDMTNLSSDYDSVIQHNGDSTVYNNIVYWVITNNYKGWIVLTSTDGYTWEFNDYVVPEKYAENLYLEAAVGFYQNYKVIAGRTNTDFMVIQMMAGNQKGKVITVKDCPYGSKPSIIIHGSIAYIGHNVKDRDSYELLAMPMWVDAEKENNIYRVCGWKGIASQYTVLKMAPTKQNYPNATGVTNYAYVISAFGMNGNQFLKKGCSFVFDAFDTSLVKWDAGGGNRLQSTLVYTMLDKYKATLSGVVSTSGTLTFTGAVEGSYDGSEDISIKIPGAAWVNVANETLEAETTGFTEIILEKPRTISRIRVYAEIVGTATNTAEHPLWLEVNGKLVADTQSATTKTDGSKKFVYIDADIVASGSFGKGYVQTNNGDTYTSPTCNKFMTNITTATEVNKILVRSKWGWSTLGVGSKLIVDIC